VPRQVAHREKGGGGLEVGCGGPRGDPGVEGPPLGENPYVGLPDGLDKVRCPQQRGETFVGWNLTV
jgi:hypothetical protein